MRIRSHTHTQKKDNWQMLTNEDSPELPNDLYDLLNDQEIHSKEERIKWFK